MKPRSRLLASALGLLLLLAVVLVIASSNGEESTSSVESVKTHAAEPVGNLEAAAPAHESAAARVAMPPASMSSTSDTPSTDEVTAWIEGVVVDEEGRGLEGVWVVLNVEGEPVWTDSEGAFRLPARGFFDRLYQRQAIAWARGRGVTAEMVDPLLPVRIVLPERPMTTVRVLDDRTEAPIASARLKFYLGGGWSSEAPFGVVQRYFDAPFPAVITDALGEAQVPGGGPIGIHVDAEGYLPWAHLDKKWHTIRLSRGPSQPRRLVLPNGEALAAAEVYVRGARTRVATDADGWFTPPTGKRAGLYAAIVVKDRLRFRFPGGGFTEPPATMEADEVLIDHFRRTGVIRSLKTQNFSDLEVATVASDYGGALQYPNPVRFAESLDWHSVESDGSFSITTGWQSFETQVAIRRRGQRDILDIVSLEGRGPYELVLTEVPILTIQVSADPAEALIGAQIDLASGNPDPIRGLPQRLTEGIARFELVEGSYTPSLTLADNPHPIQLDRIEVLDDDQTVEVDLGRLRRVSGSVTAAGAPVYPCKLYFSDPVRTTTRRTTRMTVQVDSEPDGSWSIPLLPEREWEVDVEPSDSWLDMGGRAAAHLSGVEDFARIRIPVARLELVASNAEPEALAGLLISRQILPEHDDPDEFRGFSQKDRTLKFEGGRTEIICTPCILSLSARGRLEMLEVEEIKLREGERRSIPVRFLPCGSVRVGLRSSPTPWHKLTDWNWNPSGLDLVPLGDTTLVGPRAGGDYLRKARIGSPRRVQPGDWQLTIQGPIVHRDRGGERTLLGEGTWGTELSVEEGRSTTVWVDIGEDGEVTLSPEIDDPPR